MWPDLPPDLLRNISGRLHAAADFVAFHAVCKPWHHSYDDEPATRNKVTDQFLPWLLGLAPNAKDSLKLRCVFSDINYLAPPPLPGTGRNWVASTDGTAVLYFTAANFPYGPTLHDHLTGTAMAHLPPFLDNQWVEENPSGIVYNDSTILLYSKLVICDGDTTQFRAALLCPGDQEWTVIKRTLDATYCREFCVTYHKGKILVTVDYSLWHVVTTAPRDDVLVPKPSSMPSMEYGYFCMQSHVLESRGELLWASVHITTDYLDKYWKGGPSPVLALALSVSVHALEEAPYPRWVLKKATSLADRLLFLGCPNSFAVDASRLGMNGGFAYFVYDDFKYCRLIKYNLVDNTVDFIDWLPDGWDHVAMCTWLVPRPTIAPVHQDPANTPRRNNMIHIERDW